MTGAGLTVFPTAIGWCGLAWGAAGVFAVQLPQASAAATRARLARRAPGLGETAPPPQVQAALEAITALLAGEARDLSGVEVDLTAASDFERRVYAAARGVPAGATTTYGEIAARIGVPDQAREVGQALGRNPVPILVPCHRVLAAGGAIGGFSAHGGIATKRRLLAIETSPGPLFAGR